MPDPRDDRERLLAAAEQLFALEGFAGPMCDRAIVRQAVERIIERAQSEAAGSHDLAWDDVVLLVEANAGVASPTTSDPEVTARRLVRPFVRSFALA